MEKQIYKNQSGKKYLIWIPITLWLLFTPFSGWIDIQVSQYFFRSGSFSSDPFWHILYEYGIWPGWVLTLIAAFGFVSSFFRRYQKRRLPCLFLLLTLAIGAGILIHGVFKENWGRPRPRQVMEFGGQDPFRTYYHPNFQTTREQCKSFTCGHASMGFYFFAVSFLGIYYNRRWLYWFGMILAWGLGILLSLARIAQGGHFLSDTLATALIMWLTAWTLFNLLLRRKNIYNEGINTQAV